MDRRDFILLSTLVGITSVFPKNALGSVIKGLKLNLASYNGPLLNKILLALNQLDRNQITSEKFVNELKRLYSETDLAAEFKDWIHEVPVDGSDHRVLMRHDEANRYYSIDLYYVAANTSTPPHCHHNLISTQTVLKGQLNLRQYNRVSRIDPSHILIRPSRESLVRAGDCILMTETVNNVHWFGATANAALLFNFQVKGIPGPRFDSDRNSAREYLDPTVHRNTSGDLVARELTKIEATDRFEKCHLSEFPF